MCAYVHRHAGLFCLEEAGNGIEKLTCSLLVTPTTDLREVNDSSSLTPIQSPQYTHIYNSIDVLSLVEQYKRG